MTKTELLERVLTEAYAVGVKAWHTSDPRRYQAGLLDLQLLGPDGFALAALKDEWRRLTSDQHDTIRMLRANGIRVYLWRPDDWRSGAISAELRRLAGITEYASLVDG